MISRRTLFQAVAGLFAGGAGYASGSLSEAPRKYPGVGYYVVNLKRSEPVTIELIGSGGGAGGAAGGGIVWGPGVVRRALDVPDTSAQISEWPTPDHAHMPKSSGDTDAEPRPGSAPLPNSPHYV